jgi:hypothetical protein
MTIAEDIARELAGWPDVSVTVHSPRFVEFHVGRREIGHLHGSRLADITFPVRIREQLVTARRAQPHHSHPESGWVSVPIRSADDVPGVLSLFRLSYERPWLSGSAVPAVPVPSV